MTTRRLHPQQPESFTWTPENLEWARGQIGKFPAGRQASAVIPLLFRAQEQESWLTQPAIETVATMLSMPVIRVLEVASFYFMFRLSPIGRVAHIEICGTTPCMLCGSEDLIAVCKDRISPQQHKISADGKFSWEEVECLGACANAPMIQVGKDYYEDLDSASFSKLLDDLDAWTEGKGPKPAAGSAKGRFASEPLGGLTSLTEIPKVHDHNASVALANGTDAEPRRISGGVSRLPRMEGGVAVMDRSVALALKEGEAPAPAEHRPAVQARPTDGGDDLKRIKGVGPQLEGVLHTLGYYTFAQVAAWTPENVGWVDQHLAGFRGRIERDDWVSQAKALMSGGDA